MSTDQQIFEKVRARLADPTRRVDFDAHVAREPLRPLAQPAALDRLEAELGIALPPLLRRLYLEIGDGDFGPGYGFFGAQNGLLARFRLAELGRRERKQGDWPAQVLPICDWGEGMQSCIDCQTPDYQVIFADPVCAHAEHGDGRGFLPEKIAFRNWLEAWADGVDLWRRIEKLDGYEGHELYVPRLRAALMQSSASRIDALTMLERKGPAAAAAVPQLIHLLDIELDQLIFTKIIRTLKAIGSGAGEALPALAGLTMDDDLLVRLESASALKKIQR